MFVNNGVISMNVHNFAFSPSFYNIVAETISSTAKTGLMSVQKVAFAALALIVFAVMVVVRLVLGSKPKHNDDKDKSLVKAPVEPKVETPVAPKVADIPSIPAANEIATATTVSPSVPAANEDVIATAVPPSVQATINLEAFRDVSVFGDEENSKLSPEEMRKIGAQFFQMFRPLIMESNLQAAKKLVAKMKDEASITPEVFNSFKESVDKGDLSLFGAQVKDGSVYLNEQLASYIIEEAKAFSNKLDLRNFTEKLVSDVNNGKIAVSNGDIKARFQQFLNLKKTSNSVLTEKQQADWAVEYKNLVLTVACEHEVQKLLRAQSSLSGDEIENYLLEKFASGNRNDQVMRRKKHEGEIAFVKAYLKAEMGKDIDLETIQKQLEHQKLVARVIAAGVPENQAEDYALFIEKLQQANRQFMDELEKEHMGEVPGLPEGYPETSRITLLRNLRSRLTSSGAKIPKSIIIDLMASKTPEERLAFMRARTVEDILKAHKFHADKTNLIQKVKAEIIERSKFHTKWQDCIVGQLVQGQDDAQEIFTQGVCHAVSLRWYKKEMDSELPNDEGIKDAQLYRITPIDRLTQASYSLGMHHFAKAVIAKKAKFEHLITHEYNNLLKKRMGIGLIKRVSLPNGKPETFKDQVLETIHMSHKGLAILGLNYKQGGHSVYFRFDRENKVYHFGDPNIGILSFKNEEQFFEFFKDFNDWYQEESSKITIDYLLPEIKRVKK